MIDVIGGIYQEYCWENDWNQLFGSGLRAAAAISALDVPVHLRGYAAQADLPGVEGNAKALGIQKTTVQYSKHTLIFEYEHALASPTVLPPIHMIEKASPIRLSSENVLRFGMLDGDAIVHAEGAVYDPQSAYNPVGFSLNGSSAKRLAIVCNRREAGLLTKTQDRTQQLRLLAEADKATAVVLKCGSQGVFVQSGSHTEHVPAYRTSSVWPIGSGDVFSGVFSKYWMIDGKSAEDAADLASKATALYCESKIFATSADLESFDLDPITYSETKRPKVYLAGPFFNMMQRWMIRQSRSALTDFGLNVFSPFHEVGYGTAADVAQKDIEGLEGCAGVFAVCDGLDSGTLFEIGYARKLGIPIVAFVQNETEESMKMLEGTGCDIVHDFATAIYRMAWKLHD